VLLSVGIFAFLVRCLYLYQIHDAPFYGIRIGDADAYHQWARRIAAGDWLGDGIFYQAPLYPYLLALIYKLFGDSVTTIRVIQAALGAASCVLLAAAAISLFGRRGVIAGIGLAIYPPAIFLDGLLEKSSLVTFLTCALLALLCLPAERVTKRRWIGAGAILGLLALTRENALILILPILLWIALAKSPRPRWTSAAAFVAGCAAILLPVSLRNLAIGGEMHLTTSQFGPNFYIGNHAGASGLYDGLVAGHGNAADERDDATRLAEQAQGRKLTPGEISNYWTGRSLDYIRSQPAAWAALLARKFALTFNASEMPDSESQDVYAESSWLLRILRPLDFGLLLGLAVLGAALTARLWTRLWILYAIIAAYAASVALFYVFARYRFPIVPVFLLLAAGGIIHAFDKARAEGWRKLAVPAALAIVALIFARLPLANAQGSRAPHYLNIAAALAKDPAQSDRAAEFFQRALEEAPDFPSAHMGLGALLNRAGRHQEAIPHFRAAITLSPGFSEAHYNLGLALAATGAADEAVQEFNEALRLRPADADTHFALAKTLVTRKQPELAAQHYKEGLAIQPRNAAALAGFGVALTQLGRIDDAIRQYQLAIEADPNSATAHNNLGFTLANQGKIAEAIPHFERALAIDPNFTNARQNLEQARQFRSQRDR
jgi:tetratricopeptide (TPR) repeat protein